MIHSPLAGVLALLISIVFLAVVLAFTFIHFFDKELGMKIAGFVQSFFCSTCNLVQGL